MRHAYTRHMVAALSAVALAAPLSGQSSRTALTKGVLAITHATVIPMTTDTLLRDVTIVVRDGRITAVGPSNRVHIPAGARAIDGRGMFVIPGLSDMHTHLFADDAAPDSAARYELGVLLANGITTARLMIGTRTQLAMRRELIEGKLLGPQLWLAGPQLTGRLDANAYVVTTPEAARAAVDSTVDAGYDFVKITNYVTLPVYDAIIAEARARHIRVDGHVNNEVGLQHAMESQEGLQHLDGFFEASLADSAPMKASVTQMDVYRLGNWASLDYIDNAKVLRNAGAVARSGAWVTPTLALFNIPYGAGETDEEIRARPDWQLMPDAFRQHVLDARARYWSAPTMAMRTEARRKRYVEVRNMAIKAILDSGGKITAGSDAPDWFMAEGWTLHRELKALVDAGFTPYQALVAATRSPAEFLGATKEWGTIEVGKRADIVLLSANPLDDIRNTTRIEGVSVGGRWLARPELDRLVAAAVRATHGDRSR